MPGAIESVVASGYCTGCGLCAAHFGTSKVCMKMDATGYLRPQVQERLAEDEAKTFREICPGISLNLQNREADTHVIWGPIKTCSTGWSTDDETRYRSSSGGAISAILIALLESGTADFVAHIAADETHPFRNRMRISRNRQEVLTGAGSRYSPSAPLAELQELLAQPGRFAFVGKPCDAAALRTYISTHPKVAERIVAIISFMCAGMPSEKGSEEIVRAMGGRVENVAAFAYRGNGWPGMATASMRNGEKLQMDYASSWGTILNRHLQFRCKICPDGTGEFADIVCADAWYGKGGYPDFDEKAGRSLILARTTTGKDALDLATHQGYLHQDIASVEEISLMQPYQESRKRLLLSRLVALLLHWRRIPHFYGLRLAQAAASTPLSKQLRNLVGTYKRIPKINYSGVSRGTATTSRAEESTSKPHASNDYNN